MILDLYWAEMNPNLPLVGPHKLDLDKRSIGPTRTGSLGLPVKQVRPVGLTLGSLLRPIGLFQVQESLR